MTHPVFVLSLLLFLVPVLRADSLTEGPPVSPLPLPEFLNDLDDMPSIHELPERAGGTWIYQWKNGKWSVRWVPDGSVVNVGNEQTQPLPENLLLTANPEPSTWMLMAAGLGGLAFWRRRRGI